MKDESNRYTSTPVELKVSNPQVVIYRSLDLDPGEWGKGVYGGERRKGRVPKSLSLSTEGKS